MSVLCERIAVSLGRNPVLHGVDMVARPGEVTAIVGPNGSGKTTLLRAITGEVAFSGSVRIGGLDPARAKPWELSARRAVLPQAAALAFPFTVIEVVRLGLAQAAERHGPDLAERALARVGLGGQGDRLFQELSGGQQQRAQLARVLVQVWQPVGEDGARWLLLDEPVAALDIAHQLEVMQVIRDYADRGGGVIAVMHDLNLTSLTADRVVLMAGGRVRAAGAPGEVMTDATLSEVYGCRLRVGVAPADGSPFVLPHSAA
nr:heme ABC transporter ATP-binding protein [Roseobacter sp. HKCCA0434]